MFLFVLEWSPYLLFLLMYAYLRIYVFGLEVKLK